MAESSRKDFECITSGYPLQDYQVCKYKNTLLHIFEKKQQLYLANKYGRGENLKANMDSRSEWQLFVSEKSVLTEFALMLWYEIDTSLVRTLLPVIPSQNINSRKVK